MNNSPYKNVRKFGLAFGLILFLFAIPIGLKAQDAVSKAAERGTEATQDSIWKAAREGDLDAVKAALDSGVEVDAKTEYGATALFFACDRGHEDVVKFLLEKGADPNSKDTFYKATPMTWAQSGDHKIVLMLLKHGGEGADSILMSAIAKPDAAYAKGILDTGVITKPGMIKARDSVLKIKDEKNRAEFLALFEGLDLPEPVKLAELTPEKLKQYVGKYKGDRFSVEVEASEKSLKLSANGGEKSTLVHVGEHEFSMGGNELRFEVKANVATALIFGTGGNERKLVREPATASKEKADTAQPKETHKTVAPKSDTVESDLAISSANWPGFRGNGARGIAEGQNPPTTWHVKKEDEEAENENLIWKTSVAGLGLSCPTIWDDRLYITSAVSDGDDEGLKIGLYGDVDSIEDDREYEFKVLCFSKLNGELIWERTANKGKPAVKRHAKSSHANPTVAANGEHVVAFFGSEGLFCYSADGELVWKKDLGFLDSGWFYDPGYQWGFGSSPVIYKDRVVIQCDIQDQSFVAAFDLKSGNEIWRTERDEIPGWSSPTVHEFGTTAMLITCGTKAARGYDVSDGKLLWSLKGHSEIVVPTPFVAHNLIFVASGYAPIRPIYAIDPEARGDISLDENALTNASIPWSVKRGGPYMPSPIVYGDYLYCCSNAGVFTCYDAKSGKLHYKKRIKAAGGKLSFTASPIAADGHLYLTAEDGRVVLVEAGPEFEVVEVNHCGESILATPAISDGVLYFRTQDSLIAVGEGRSN